MANKKNSINQYKIIQSIKSKIDCKLEKSKLMLAALNVEAYTNLDSKSIYKETTMDYNIDMIESSLSPEKAMH